MATFIANLPTLLVIGALASAPHAVLVWLRQGIEHPGWLVFLGLVVAHNLGFGMALGVVLHSLGERRCDLGRTLGRALRRLPSMTVAGLLSALAVVGLLALGMMAARHAGFLALPVVVATVVICSGLSASLRLSEVTAFAEERSGAQSLARSIALTRGRRLRIFLAEIVLGILVSPLNRVLDRLDPGSVSYLGAELAVGGIGLGLWAAFVGVVYARQRQDREQADGAAIADAL